MSPKSYSIIGFAFIIFSGAMIIYNVMTTFAVTIPLLVGQAFGLLGMVCGIYLVLSTRKKEGDITNLE